MSSSSITRQASTSGKSTSELITPEYRKDLVNTTIGRGLAVHERPGPERASSTGELRRVGTAPHEQSFYQDSDDEDYRHNAEFEKALQESIKQTSKGDADEDRDIDRAIRASIAHLQKAITKQGSSSAVEDEDADDEQLKLAIAESLKGKGAGPSSTSFEQQETGVLKPPAIPPRSPRRSPSPLPQAAIQKAAQEVETGEPGGSSLAADVHADADRSLHDLDDEDLKKALAESQKMGEDEERAKAEEEIVLEYVKKQSLLEENYRRSQTGGQQIDGESSGT